MKYSNSNLLKSRVDGLSTLQEGSTTGDAELIDIRTGYDGTDYNSAGNSVRKQINGLYNILKNAFNYKYEYKYNFVENPSNTFIIGDNTSQLCLPDIPITHKGRLFLHAYINKKDEEYLFPNEFFILRKEDDNFYLEKKIYIDANESMIDSDHPNWIKIDLNYTISNNGIYYVAAYQNISAWFYPDMVENYTGYYAFKPNTNNLNLINGKIGVYTADQYLTNSAVLYYPEIDIISSDKIELNINDLTNKYNALSTSINNKWDNTIGDFLGDSITAQDKYTQKLRELYNITTNKNTAVSGACISNIRGTNIFSDRISSMPLNCDFVFMFGGTNDWGNNCPLGIKTDKTLDTFYGALYVTLTALRTRFPTKPIFVSTILQRNYHHNEDMENNSNGNSIEEFNTAIKYTAKKFGCIIIDLWQCGIYPDINGSTYMTDGVHINEVGGSRVAMFIKDSMERYSPY